MIKVFVKSNCIGSKKAEKFLNDLEVNYSRTNISYQTINENDLLDMYSIIDNNTSDLINLTSSFFDDKQDLKEMIIKKRYSKKEAITLITKNQDILNYPIVLKYNEQNDPIFLIIGYDNEELNNLLNYSQLEKRFLNFNKSFNLKKCCIFDEVLSDEINLIETPNE